MPYKPVDTAIKVILGPAIDDGDFKVREELIAYNAAGMEVTAILELADGTVTHTAIIPTTGDDHDWVHTNQGYYELEIPAASGDYNNDEEGILTIVAFVTGVLPFRSVSYDVIPAALYAKMVTAYSVTRGLAGTALPDAAADAAAGLPVSDAGGLDIDTLLGTLTSLAAETRDANVLDQFRRTIAIIEHEGRASHTHQPMGNILFVDPVNGDTHANGNRGGITDPYSLIQDCHDNAVTDSHHDLIILLSGASGGPTTLTETITISKRYTYIRGPGRDFIITRSGNGDTISVTADGVGFSGFQLNTAATGSGNGIKLTDADFLEVRDLWINATQGDGVNILRGENCQIFDNVFTDTGQGGAGEGVHIVGTAGASSNNSVHDNKFRDCAGDAIKIESGTTNNTSIQRNTIEGSTGWGINIGASSIDALVSDNRLGNNASGDITDGGTTTVLLNNEDVAKASVMGTLANAAAAGDPTSVDTLMQYIKQLINTLEGTVGIPIMPAEAAPANNVSIVEILRGVYVDTNEVQGKLPTNKIMGSSVVTDKDDEIDAIKTITDALPDAGALSTITTHLTDIKGGTFSGVTDSLEAVRNRGDSAWITAVGFSTHSAAAVWSVATRTLTSFGTLAQDIWDKATSALTTVGSIGKLLVDNINATISSRSTVTKAQVNAEVVDVLVTDIHAEPASIPAATSSLKDKIGWIFSRLRNKRTFNTSGVETVKNDGGSANIASRTVTDDATTLTKSKWS